jgi:hypothetical protein
MHIMHQLFAEQLPFYYYFIIIIIITNQLLLAVLAEIIATCYGLYYSLHKSTFCVKILYMRSQNKEDKNDAIYIILLLLYFTFSLNHTTSVFIEHLVISYSNEVFQLE